MATFTDKQFYILGGAALVIGGFAIWKLKQGAQAVAEFTEEVVTEDLNPTSDQNLAYRGVNGIGSALTGEEDFRLGRWIYKAIHE